MSEVFKTLSKLDCSKHIEKKGKLSYLSWTWAWQKLMEHYPSSSFEFHANEVLEDGSVTVSCTVTVEGIARTMWLPVMDNRNDAIKNPDSRKISDAKMRCLVKCIALHGLGLYIYAGEDLPEQEVEYINEAQLASLKMVFANGHVNEKEFLERAKIAKIELLEAKRYDGSMAWINAKMKETKGEENGTAK